MVFIAKLRHRKTGEEDVVEFAARDMAFALAAMSNWLIDRPDWRMVSLAEA